MANKLSTFLRSSVCFYLANRFRSDKGNRDSIYTMKISTATFREEEKHKLVASFLGKSIYVKLD